jgi:hypothetical protein
LSKAKEALKLEWERFAVVLLSVRDATGWAEDPRNEDGD